MANYCIDCGTSLPDEAKFCAHCGKQVQASHVPLAPIPATPTDNPSEGNIWTPQSKKDMSLGLIVILTGIGTEPVLSSMSKELSFVSLLILLVGICISLIGYFSHK
jgi:zinc-ribbon domain